MILTKENKIESILKQSNDSIDKSITKQEQDCNLNTMANERSMSILGTIKDDNDEQDELKI